MSFKKAVKHQAKLRLALCGLPGSGKTFSALRIASEMAALMRAAGHGEGRIALIDSERGSSSLYADKFDFDVCELDSFSPLAYVEKIKEAESAGYDFIIADSISHAWTGTGGALDQKDKAAERDPRANSWTAWRTVTPKHDALVSAMVGCKAHFFATMRQKIEHVQERNEATGKTEIRKIGLAEVQREGISYEFTIVGDVDHSHTLRITKTRIDGIDIDERFERPGEAFAKKLYTWLMSGSAPTPSVDVIATVAATEPTKPNGQGGEAVTLAAALSTTFKAYLAGMTAAISLASLDKAATSAGKPARGTPEHKIASEHYIACKARLLQMPAVIL